MTDITTQSILDRYIVFLIDLEDNQQFMKFFKIHKDLDIHTITNCLS